MAIKGPFEIEIEGLDEALAMFKGVEEGMLDLRQLGAWKAVYAQFRKIEQEQFESEGRKGASGAWAPLNPDYARIKLSKYGDVGILRAGGQGYRSLTVEGADGAIYEESAQELTLGTSIAHMKYHQTGTKRMPKREPISLTRDQKKQMIQPVHDKLRQLIANAKLRKLRTQ